MNYITIIGILMLAISGAIFLGIRKIPTGENSLRDLINIVCVSVLIILGFFLIATGTLKWYVNDVTGTSTEEFARQYEQFKKGE